jgi:hypothetical protein
MFSLILRVQLDTNKQNRREKWREGRAHVLQATLYSDQFFHRAGKNNWPAPTSILKQPRTIKVVPLSKSRPIESRFRQTYLTRTPPMPNEFGPIFCAGYLPISSANGITFILFFREISQESSCHPRLLKSSFPFFFRSAIQDYPL